MHPANFQPLTPQEQNPLSCSAISSPIGTKPRKTRQSWTNDGVDGGQSSLDVVLDWLTTASNYAKWRGDGSGVTKKALCGEIIGKMKSVGILHRTIPDHQKLNEIQVSYNKVLEF